ncbi:hypothetical protein CDAR_69531 [Caerostris darwini]|uniref:Uncharacterized protein n=1 Tax=Caerostris darwini TaxID=1538125 RepID=A0AAV4U0N3_9ARAC|nr:hypothetical protein CDAR_69531 [Caerostris darwini]
MSVDFSGTENLRENVDKHKEPPFTWILCGLHEKWPYLKKKEKKNSNHLGSGYRKLDLFMDLKPLMHLIRINRKKRAIFGAPTEREGTECNFRFLPFRSVSFVLRKQPYFPSFLLPFSTPCIWFPGFRKWFSGVKESPTGQRALIFLVPKIIGKEKLSEKGKYLMEDFSSFLAFSVGNEILDAK